MHNHWSSIWGVAGFDPAEEGQERGGMFGDPVVRPGCELEVTNLTLLIRAALQEQIRRIKCRLRYSYSFNKLF